APFFALVSTCFCVLFFFFTDSAPPETYPLSLHDALPICAPRNHECRCQGKCDCYEVRKHGTYRSEKPAEVEMGDRVGTAGRLSSACRCPDPVSITGTSVSK